MTLKLLDVLKVGNAAKMNSELFPVEVALSPRLKWLRDKNIETRFVPDLIDETECPWGARVVGENISRYGNTEDEAIVELAKLKGWRLWNEA